MHFDFDQTVALAGFAAAAFDIKAESPRAIATDFGLTGGGKQLSQWRE